MLWGAGGSGGVDPPGKVPVRLEWDFCGSVFDRFCVEALKMTENHEKPCFTFFAFLPPYIGVSGSLVSCKRKSVKRSIEVSKILNFMPCGSVFGLGL